MAEDTTNVLERPTTGLAGIDFDAERHPSLAARRAKAFEIFAHCGIPTTKEEAWKYTPLRDVTGGYFLQGGMRPVTAAELAPHTFPEMDPVQIVFVNGFLNEDLSTSLHDVPGLEIRDLEWALTNRASVLDGRFGSRLRIEENVFAALNEATWVNGAFIHLAKNANIERPIHVVHVNVVDANGATSYAAPRMFVVAEEGAKAFLLESSITQGDGDTLNAAATEIFIAPNASLEHIKLQSESDRATHISSTEVRQERDSQYNQYTIIYGGKLVRNDLNLFLNGESIHSRMDGVIVLGDDQHADNHTRIDHAFAHCDSFQVYKHILKDHSKAVFNGQIYVHQDAQKTDAKQTNQTLLLSPTATIDSKPQLEIFADDVKCTHGATVGHLDEAPMFYMQARGIPKDEAQALMVYAFAADVLEKITRVEVRGRLESLLFEKLGLSSS